MFYQSELQFFCNVLHKSRIGFATVSPEESMERLLHNVSEGLVRLFGHYALSVSEFFGNPEPGVIYRHTDSLHLCFIGFLLPQLTEPTLFVLGPFLQQPLSTESFLELCERHSIPPTQTASIMEPITALPIVPDGSALYTVLDSLGERIWGAQNYQTVDASHELTLPPTPLHASFEARELDGILSNMKVMEQRYAYENEIIRAVSRGQLQQIDRLISSFSIENFEARTADPLRNFKNYCIIMNTILRKAAEGGGVHPLYLDSTSSSFARQIEQANDTESTSELMPEMFRTYCRLVRKHSMRNYSPIVQKTIVLIESDLSASLSLEPLARVQGITPGYLATLFKRETGRTVTEYIREPRMRHAEHLLSTTHLQIQTVALHCGIMDVQYFSKLFKRFTGKSPKAYRAELAQLHSHRKTKNGGYKQ